MKDLKKKFKEYVENLNFDLKKKKLFFDAFEFKFKDKDTEILNLIIKEEEKINELIKKETESHSKKIADLQQRLETQKAIIIENELDKCIKIIADFYLIEVKKDNE